MKESIAKSNKRYSFSVTKFDNLFNLTYCTIHALIFLDTNMERKKKEEKKGTGSDMVQRQQALMHSERPQITQ
jgi:hypothetical protein